MARKNPTPGAVLEQQLVQALHDAERALLPGCRDLAILCGLSRQGDFVVPQENVLVQAGDILVRNAQVYTYANSVVMQRGEATAPDVSLVPLRRDMRVEAYGRGLLANLLVCQNGENQFPPPKWFLEVLLHAEPVLARLPRIRHQARRPIFDSDFVLRGPGWHPDAGLLVLGPAVEPILDNTPDTNLPVIERLPPHLHKLLGEFCFCSDADAANAIAMMLTGLLANHFVTEQKAIFPIDGNQPNLGKTWLLRVAGIVLDGIDPRLVVFTTDEEELYKRICANGQDLQQSLLIFDNAKTAIGKEIKSPVIESMSMARELSLRILGKSGNFTRLNDLLWAFTMNNSRFCHDLITRSCPIQLFYEGKPEKRKFCENPLRYATAHRIEILGELVGMVLSWNQAGRPLGQKQHRCEIWAGTIGGIMQHAGIPEFLDNADEVAARFSTELEELAALAETVIKSEGPYIERASRDEE
jgi:hypothetical protein